MCYTLAAKVLHILTQIVSLTGAITFLGWYFCLQKKERKPIKSFTVATAESCTLNKVYAWLGSKSGSSNYLRRGQGAYHIDEKVEHLDVNRQNAEKCNCVNQQVADEMAVGLLDEGYAFAASTTGYVGASDESTNPFFWFCIASPFDKVSYKCSVDLSKVTSETKKTLRLLDDEEDRVVCQTLFAYIVMCSIKGHFDAHENNFRERFTYENDKKAIDSFKENLTKMNLSYDAVESVVDELHQIKLMKTESDKDK